MSTEVWLIHAVYTETVRRDVLIRPVVFSSDPLGFWDMLSDISLHRGTRTTLYKNNPPLTSCRHVSSTLNPKCLYLLFLSSQNLVRHFWMMWSTKSDSGIRFSDCLSFSKDLTWRRKMTLTRRRNSLLSKQFGKQRATVQPKVKNTYFPSYL